MLHNSGLFISSVTSLSPHWVKWAHSCISCIGGDRKIKISICWNFELRSLFLRSLTQNIAVLTPVMTSLTQHFGQKGHKLTFHLPMVIKSWNKIFKGNIEVKHLFLKPLSQNIEALTLRGDVINPKWVKRFKLVFHIPILIERWKSKVKRHFEVTYLFIKTFTQNFEHLTQLGDVINPNLARKRTQTCVSATNDVRKMKIKSKGNFEVRYSFMKLFSRNLETLFPCRDVTISKFGQKDSNCGWYIICRKYFYKVRSSFTQFWVNDVITRDKLGI